MAIKMRELIKKLEEKDPDAEVEFIVIETNDTLVCVDCTVRTATRMAKLLKMFKP